MTTFIVNEQAVSGRRDTNWPLASGGVLPRVIVYTPDDFLSTRPSQSPSSLGNGPLRNYDEEKARKRSKCTKLLDKFPSMTEIKQYVGVILCGLCIWGTSWFLLKETVLPGGYLFNMSAVVIAGYVVGQTLERLTTIPPLVGMTLIGAIYRNFGETNFLENAVANNMDYHLRRLYPVIILTKGPLGWNWDYIKDNPFLVFSLATLPWTVECLCVAIFSNILMNFPWYWGLHLGSILASVSPAVVVPTASALAARGLGTERKIAQLVGNAGGLDTAFTEGIFGIINAGVFYPTDITYRIVKGVLAVPLGIALGILWGMIASAVPDQTDGYAATVRSALMLSGGVLLMYAAGAFGWGGTAGVAVMVCAATAATRWARRGWPLGANPVAEVYKLLWRVAEPMLFTLSGYHFDASAWSAYELGMAAACAGSALAVRLIAAFLIALAGRLTVKESLFVTITWIPKAIVEAVLVRAAADSARTDAAGGDRRAAALHANIIVISIILTSTFGSLLTTALGPVLLSQESRVAPEGAYSMRAVNLQHFSKDTRKKNQRPKT